jgi:putative DNA primase/helicase
VRFLFLENQALAFFDASGALPDRYIPLRLLKSFSGQEDTSLFTAKLLPELNGILRWAVEGWARLHERRRFVIPDSASGLHEAMTEQSNPLAEFLKDSYEVGEGDDFISEKDDVYSTYKIWAENRKVSKVWDKPIFFRNLNAVPGADTEWRYDPDTKKVRDAKGNPAPRRVRGLKSK